MSRSHRKKVEFRITEFNSKNRGCFNNSEFIIDRSCFYFSDIQLMAVPEVS